MAGEIARLFVAVSADVDKAVKGLDAVNAKVGVFGSLGGVATGAGVALAGAGLAAAAGLGSAVKIAANFEHAMSNVKAVMTPDEVLQFGDALSALAVTLGEDTSFTAREAAAGIEELIKAGIPAKAVLGGAAKAALDLAAATGIAVPDAATISSQVLNAYHKDVGQLAGVVDFLAGTANATAADMGQLKFALSAVGAVAPGIGLSFEDTATALGLFADSALIGSDAGTSFKTFLLNLQPDTKKQISLFKELGIITKDGSNQFFDAAGNVKDLAGISDVLTRALGKMNKQQQQSTLAELFGTDAIRAATILTEKGGGAIRNLRGEIGKIKAADSAAERLNNLDGAMDRLRGTAESIAIKVGTALIPGITNIVRGLDRELPRGFSTAQAVFAAFTKDSGALGIVLDNIRHWFGDTTANALEPFFNWLMKAIPQVQQFAEKAGLAFSKGLGWIIENGPKVIAQLDQITAPIRDTLTRAFFVLLGAGVAVKTYFEANLPPAFQAVTDAGIRLRDFLDKNLSTALQALAVTAAVVGVIMTANLVGSFIKIAQAAGLAGAGALLAGANILRAGITAALGWAAVLAPVAAVVAAIGLVILGAFKIREAFDRNMGGFRESVVNAVTAVLSTFEQFFTFLGNATPGDAGLAFLQLAQGARTAIDQFRQFGPTVFQGVADGMDTVQGFLDAAGKFKDEFAAGFPSLDAAIRTAGGPGLFPTQPTLPQSTERAAAAGFATGAVQVQIINPVISNLVDAEAAGRAAAAQITAAIEAAANRATAVAPAHLLNHPH